ncbi:MAG: ROK family protein, partial [Actinomycetota bacterium]|nr:ROK family protein [Actinomycetota bacterium]
MTVDRQVVAVDVGGTGIKAALVGRDLTATHVVRVPTRRIDGSVDVTQIAELVGLLAEKAAGGVGGVGVAVPGIVDDTTGVVVTAVNLGWTDLDLRARLADQTGLPLLVRHDVRAGGLAEFTVGAAAGAANALFVPIGTGIAAAARIDGHLLSAGGYLGEIGHMVVDTGGALCTCGQRGCLET